MERIAFFDTKPYDRIWFDRLNKSFEIEYFESRLRPGSVRLAEGCRAVCAFVNDDIGASTVRSLADMGVGLIAMRCAGYNNVALKEAAGKAPRSSSAGVFPLCGRRARHGNDTHAQPQAAQGVYPHP